MRPRVTDNSFDDASTLCAWPYGSRSRLSQAFHAYDVRELDDPGAPIDLEAQEEVDQDTTLESYLGGSYDTSLLYNNVEHAARQVKNERYISCLLKYICCQLINPY